MGFRSLVDPSATGARLSKVSLGQRLPAGFCFESISLLFSQLSPHIQLQNKRRSSPTDSVTLQREVSASLGDRTCCHEGVHPQADMIQVFSQRKTKESSDPCHDDHNMKQAISPSTHRKSFDIIIFSRRRNRALLLLASQDSVQILFESHKNKICRCKSLESARAFFIQTHRILVRDTVRVRQILIRCPENDPDAPVVIAYVIRGPPVLFQTWFVCLFREHRHCFLDLLSQDCHRNR